MNRSIKFRAWIDRLNQFATIDEINFVLNEITYFDGQHNVHTILLKDDVIEQYTGLKDKNGIEIYEGDMAIYELNKEIGVCVISPYHGVYFECLNEDTFGTCEEMILKIEIIGNIHENADLLND